MSARRLLALLPATLALASAAADSAPARPAHARPGGSIYHNRHLWATIDVCDTRAHPHTLGVRASMPGSGRRGEQMFMRFRVQYVDAAGHWRFLTDQDSGYVPAGPATYKARQAGWSFSLRVTGAVPRVVRGAVAFEWRRGHRVVRSARKHTTAGHHVAAGADPPGYSAATCQIR
jgi:hypothetical protein